ncbi:MAG TPA: hypothetical protein ENK66_01165, partial [Arcobacter sp.]|nr:hypothetical protein [Arcobacter sp.]
MNKILMVLPFTVYLVAVEPSGLPPREAVTYSSGVAFEIDNSYTEIPTSGEVNYSKYRPITNAEEAKAKAKKEAEEAKAKAKEEAKEAKAKAKKEAEEAKA